MNARQLRLVRAALVSSVATLIAAISHTFGGGSAPHPLLIVAIATLLMPVCALLFGVRQSRARVASGVVLSQVVFHILFQALGSPTAADVLGEGSGVTNGVHTHQIDLASLGSGSAAATPSAMMLFAHFVAAILTTVLVWHGEAIMRAVARWVDAHIRRASPATPAAHRKPPRLRSAVFVALDAAFSRTEPQRGPPRLSSGISAA